MTHITDKEIEEGLDEAYKKAGHNAYFGNGFKAGVRFALNLVEKYGVLPVISKSTFNFDYVGKSYRNNDGYWVGDSCTETIKAWDEEHAILKFEKLHPDTPYDEPY
jgi:hypothetical protein